MSDTQVQIVIDKNKSPEDYLKEAEQYYIISPLIREKYPDLVKLVCETESMDDEERAYWLQVMAIMSEEQIQRLQGIMINERDKLKGIDQNYQNNLQAIREQKPIKIFDEEEMKERMEKLRSAEAESQKAEAGQEKDILKQLSQL